MTSFRDDSPDALDPPWLRGDTGGSILFAMRSVLDALCERTRQAAKLGMPGAGTPTALGYIGNDRNIERGPTVSDAGYAAQLTAAFDTWQNAGGARTLLTQLNAYFAPTAGPPMRAVSASAVWHEINTSTNVVTRTVVGTNWSWDATGAWWRGWAIMYGASYWNLDYWGQPGNWGDGGVWGSNMTLGQAISLNAIVRKWRPANVTAQLIVTFDSTLYLRTNLAPPNPNGNGHDYAWQATQSANFFEPQV